MKKEICLAGIDDIPQLIVLLIVLFSQDIEFEPNKEKQYNGLHLIISHPEIGEILVFKNNGEIIGMVSLLYSISTALGGKVAILEDMVIDPAFRNMGFGSMLLNEAIKFSIERNCLRVTLLTDYDNEIAIHFYEKFKFSKSPMIPLRLVF
jgi:ribosomal protein S18 acetylase RimI-like enzyme